MCFSFYVNLSALNCFCQYCCILLPKTIPMKKVFFLFALVSMLSFNACETDFDVTAEWKDITVVYGLISQNDSLHYVKINKAFLGEGNALTYAQEADSASYLNNLEVRIIEKAGSTETRSFNLDTTTVFNKEEGRFSAPEQVDYKAAFIVPSDYANRDHTYHLEIKTKITGQVITAQTPLVHACAV